MICQLFSLNNSLFEVRREYMYNVCTQLNLGIECSISYNVSLDIIAIVFCRLITKTCLYHLSIKDISSDLDSSIHCHYLKRSVYFFFLKTFYKWFKFELVDRFYHKTTFLCLFSIHAF